jgi:anaphase-promoting complex subunit 2
MVLHAEKAQSDWSKLAGGKRYSYAKRAASIFWLGVNFDDNSDSTLKQLAKEITRATDGACEALKTLMTTEEIQHSATRDYFSALILSCAPTEFVRCIDTVLTTSLMGAHVSFLKCDNAKTVKSTNQSLAVSPFWTNVHVLGWYHFFRETVHKVFYQGIDRCVSDICAERYDTPMLHILERWKKSAVLPWLVAIDGNRSSKFESRSEEALRQLVDLVVVETYVGARIKQLYNIIAEFPESACAVVELCSALARTRQHCFLACSLRLTLCRRLLHLGANTSQIIEMYISTIKVLRILDPRRILLDTVTLPVRRYLQHRKDTVRCIVANLTDELSGELYEELHRTKSMILGSCDSDNEIHDSPGEDWVPNPSNCQNANPKTMRDILSMLISIYGTREIFVSEYRRMLADK